MKKFLFFLLFMGFHLKAAVDFVCPGRPHVNLENTYQVNQFKMVPRPQFTRSSVKHIVDVSSNPEDIPENMPEFGSDNSFTDYNGTTYTVLARNSSGKVTRYKAQTQDYRNLSATQRGSYIVPIYATFDTVRKVGAKVHMTSSFTSSGYVEDPTASGNTPMEYTPHNLYTYNWDLTNSPTGIGTMYAHVPLVTTTNPLTNEKKQYAQITNPEGGYLTTILNIRETASLVNPATRKQEFPFYTGAPWISIDKDKRSMMCSYPTYTPEDPPQPAGYSSPMLTFTTQIPANIDIESCRWNGEPMRMTVTPADASTGSPARPPVRYNSHSRIPVRCSRH